MTHRLTISSGSRKRVPVPGKIETRPRTAVGGTTPDRTQNRLWRRLLIPAALALVTTAWSAGQAGASSRDCTAEKKREDPLIALGALAERLSRARQAENRARKFEERSHWDDAGKEWRTALRHCVDDGHCRCLQEQLEGVEKGGRLFKIMIRFQNQALDHEKQGDWEAAEQAWQKAHQKCDRLANCLVLKFRLGQARFTKHFVRGQRFFDQGNDAMALQSFHKAHNICGDGLPKAENCGEVAEAISRSMDRIIGGSARAYAKKLERAGEWERAVKSWEAALKRCREEKACDEIRGHLGHARYVATREHAAELVRRGDWAGAVEVYDQAYLICDDSSQADQDCKQAESNHGIALTEGRFDTAVRSIRRAGGNGEPDKDDLEPVFRAYATLYETLVYIGNISSCRALVRMVNGLAMRSRLDALEQAKLLAQVLGSKENSENRGGEHQQVTFDATGFKPEFVGEDPKSENQVRSFVGAYYSYMSRGTSAPPLPDIAKDTVIKGYWFIRLAHVARELARAVDSGRLSPSRVGNKIRSQICQ